MFFTLFFLANSSKTRRRNESELHTELCVPARRPIQSGNPTELLQTQSKAIYGATANVPFQD
jgi:hypothetical protein